MDLRISDFLIAQHEERPLYHYGNFSFKPFYDIFSFFCVL